MFGQKRELAYEPIAGFQSEKAAQIAAFFVSMAGGRIDKLKLAKLQYLAEREHLAVHALPMVYDELYSLPHGPICSSSLNGAEGKLGARDEWKSIASSGKQDIHGRPNVVRDDLDHVSDAEFDVLSKIWDRFGTMSASALRAYTHDPNNCPEYTEVEGARLAISYAEVLNALGYQNADQLASDIEAFRRLSLAY
jgi:uncharacterized phage-associated protein